MTAGYPIPETIDPGEAVCIPVFVPNDPLYIACFWAALEYMGTWHAWERDDAHRGQQVAAVWKSWAEFSREMWASQGCTGGGGLVDVRQNGALPCKLEKQTEPEGEWIEFADLSGCLTIDYTPPAPFPEGDPDDNKDLGAAALVYWFREVLYIPVCDSIDNGDSDSETLDLAVSVVQQISPYDDLAQACADFIADLKQKSQVDRDTKKAASAWEEMYKVSNCKQRGDGHWLDQAADSLFQWLNQSADWLFESLNSFANVLDGADLTRGITAGQDAGGTGGGASFGYTPPADAECAQYGLWMIEYDFTAEPGPFQTLDLPGQAPYGIWESGVGWRATAAKVQVCNQIARYCLTMGIPINSYLLDVQVYGTLSSGYLTDGADCDSVILNHVSLNLPGAEGLPEDSKWVDDLVVVYNSTNIRTTITSIRIWGCGTNTLENL